MHPQSYQQTHQQQKQDEEHQQHAFLQDKRQPHYEQQAQDESPKRESSLGIVHHQHFPPNSPTSASSALASPCLFAPDTAAAAAALPAAAAAGFTTTYTSQGTRSSTPCCTNIVKHSWRTESQSSDTCCRLQTLSPSAGAIHGEEGRGRVMVSQATQSNNLLNLPNHLLLLVFCFLGSPNDGLLKASAVRTAPAAPAAARALVVVALATAESRVQVQKQLQPWLQQHSQDAEAPATSCNTPCWSAPLQMGEVSVPLRFAGLPSVPPCPYRRLSMASLFYYALPAQIDRLEWNFSRGLFERELTLRVGDEGVSVTDVLLLNGGKRVAYTTSAGIVGIACTDTGKELAALESPRQQQQQRLAAALSLAHTGEQGVQEEQQKQEDECLFSGHGDGIVCCCCAV
ncbi:hypothetical protein cyc_04094 [Cyclospora cayetanensis]|uniref:Uncharacterized protein n=1 Tax=Cyclospora cayetanensis TaxID=88456 RepID=A0A1D3D4U9_9EIME|nr:hypothetical protein cyc_04094 [Cyclospora cayetanensis]